MKFRKEDEKSALLTEQNERQVLFYTVTSRLLHDNAKIHATSARPQDQDQDSLLVKRRNDNHSPGPVIRELVPSSHQRSELRNTILCIFSGWDQRIGEGIPVPDSLGEETTFINICIGNGSLKCQRVLISTTPYNVLENWREMKTVFRRNILIRTDNLLILFYISIHYD